MVSCGVRSIIFCPLSTRHKTQLRWNAFICSLHAKVNRFCVNFHVCNVWRTFGYIQRRVNQAVDLRDVLSSKMFLVTSNDEPGNSATALTCIWPSLAKNEVTRQLVYCTAGDRPTPACALSWKVPERILLESLTRRHNGLFNTTRRRLCRRRKIKSENLFSLFANPAIDFNSYTPEDNNGNKRHSSLSSLYRSRWQLLPCTRPHCLQVDLCMTLMSAKCNSRLVELLSFCGASSEEVATVCIERAPQADRCGRFAESNGRPAELYGLFVNATCRLSIHFIGRRLHVIWLMIDE